MARMPDIRAKTDLPADKHHIFDAIEEAQGSVILLFSLLLNSPELAARMSPLRKYLFFESTLEPPVKNLAILIAARECDCAFIWSNAVAFCRESGVKEEVIDVVGHCRPLDSLMEEEALQIKYGREVLRDHGVSDATFHAAKTRYGNQALMDLTATLGFYSMLGHMLNAFDIQPQPDRPRLP